MLNQKYRTIMCKYFNNDKPCPLGSRCHFAHGKDELRKIGDPLPQNTPQLPNAQILKATGMDPSQTGDINPVVVNNYKTMICKYWEQGKCKYQQKCSFAHGEVEKRNNDAGDFNNPNRKIDPLKVPAFEYLLRYQQLSRICADLQKYYPNNEEVMSIITTANELLTNWKINNTQEVLMKFIYKISLTDQEKEINRNIIKDACNYAEQFLEHYKSDPYQKFLGDIMKRQTMAQPMYGGSGYR